VVGSESTGLSEIWRSSATKTVQIPMLGDLDSMNVSVAAGILLFEAIRQRNFLT
jgi:TrmH family RNA methyltransferase